MQAPPGGRQASPPYRDGGLHSPRRPPPGRPPSKGPPNPTSLTPPVLGILPRLRNEGRAQSRGHPRRQRLQGGSRPQLHPEPHPPVRALPSEPQLPPRPPGPQRPGPHGRGRRPYQAPGPAARRQGLQGPTRRPPKLLRYSPRRLLRTCPGRPPPPRAAQPPAHGDDDAASYRHPPFYSFYWWRINGHESSSARGCPPIPHAHRSRSGLCRAGPRVDRRRTPLPALGLAAGEVEAAGSVRGV